MKGRCASRVVRSLTGALVVVGAIAATATAWLWSQQRGMLYRPPPPAAAATARGFVEIETATEDGLRLRAWLRRGRDGAPAALVLHGNADSLLGAAGWSPPLVPEDWTLLLVEYRGYGGNPGRPDEEGLVRDARAALTALGALGIPPRRIAYVGWSLGTGVAARLADEAAPGALVLAAAFTSVADRAAELFPVLPVRFIVRDQFDTLSRAPSLRCPTLVVHGSHDAVVPFEHGQRVFAALGGPKEFLAVEGAGHDPFVPGTAAAVRDFLVRVLDGRGTL